MDSARVVYRVKSGEAGGDRRPSRSWQWYTPHTGRERCNREWVGVQGV